MKFSNGKPMTSADVKFSIDQASAAAKGWGYINTAIKSVAAPSPQTVVVNLKYPWAPLLADLSLFSNAIVPANYGGQTETEFYQHPIGTGPFKWDYWHKGSALKLVRNPYFWQPGKPYLSSVTWTDVPSDNTRELQLKGGQAQVDEFPAWSTVSSLKATSGITMNLFNSTRTDYLAFNELAKPFQDVHVRRAISLAIDRNALVKAVLFGNGTPANSLFPPQVPYYQTGRPRAAVQPGRRPRPRWPSPVVPHGFSTTILVPVGHLRLPDHRHDPAVRAQAARHQGQHPAAGPEHGQHRLAEPQVRHDADATGRWTSPTRTSWPPSRSTRPPAPGRSSPPTTTRTVVKDTHLAEQTLATSARQTLYNTVQDRLGGQDAFMAFLYYSPYAYATTSNVHGFFVTPLGNYHMENVWLSK